MDQENQENIRPLAELEEDSDDCNLQSLALDDGSSQEAETVIDATPPANDVEVQNVDGILSTPIVEQSASGALDAIDPPSQAASGADNGSVLSEASDDSYFFLNGTAEACAIAIRRIIENGVREGGVDRIGFIVQNRMNGLTSRATFASRYPPVDALNEPQAGEPRLDEPGSSDADPDSNSEAGARTGRRRCPRSFSVFN